MHKPRKINQRLIFVLLSGIVSILITSCTFTKEGTNNGQLVIHEQGSFAVGGSVITNPGTFDPIKDGAFNPTNQSSAGQTLHGDHAYVFYQIPTRSVNCHWSFGTGMGNNKNLANNA